MLGKFTRKRKRKRVPPKVGDHFSLFKKREKKKTRQEEIKKRKNFFPALFVNILLWISVVLIVYFADPIDQGAVQMFFAFIFLSLVFSFSLLFAHTRRGLITSTSVVVFLILCYFGVGNIINFFLLFGLAIAIEIYFSKN